MGASSSSSSFIAILRDALTCDEVEVILALLHAVYVLLEADVSLRASSSMPVAVGPASLRANSAMPVAVDPVSLRASSSMPVAVDPVSLRASSWQCRLLPFSSLIHFRILAMSTAALQQLNPLSDFGNVDCCPSAA